MAKLSRGEIFIAIQEDLAFYRKRLFTAYFYALVIAIFVLAGRFHINTDYYIISNLFYSVLYAMIAFFVFRFHDSYRVRIYWLRYCRNELAKDAGLDIPVFPPPKNGEVDFHPFKKLSRRDRLFTLSPSMQFVYVTWFLCILGILLVWFGSRVPSLEKWC